MELIFVVAVKDICQLQPSTTVLAAPCKVCDQGHSVGKIKFTRNKKMFGCLPPPPPGISFSKKMLEMLRKWKSMTLNGALLRYLKRCFGSWDCRETFGK